MALTCWQRPDHSTIAKFVSGMGAHKRMDHSTLRGTVKVNIQWRLYCLVHNLEKITRYSPGQKLNRPAVRRPIPAPIAT